MSEPDQSLRTIVICEVERDDFTILKGDHVVTRLTADECLPVVAKLLLAPEKPCLRKIEDYWQIESRIREEIMSQLRPVDRLLILDRLRVV